MAQSNSIQTVMEYLIEDAGHEYSADAFTLIANPKLGNVGIRFRVPYDTTAKRPTPPPEHIRPPRWDHVVAEVMSDNFDEFHMTWKWPADPDQMPDNLESVARNLSQRTGATIEAR